MRIAFIGLLARYPASRGTPLRILEMAKSVSRNNDIHLVCMEAADSWEENVKYVPLNIKNRRLCSTSLLFLLPSLIFMWLKLYKILKKIRPDVAHVHTHNSMLLSFLPLKTLGIPVIFDAHGGYIDELIMTYGRETTDVRMWRLLEPILFRVSDRVTVVTEGLREYVESRGISSTKIVRVPGGVTGDFFKSRGKSKRDLGISDSDYVIMYTGNFNAWQGIDILINTAKIVVERNDSVKFVLVGNTSHEKYAKLAEGLGLSSFFIFTGQKRREELPDFLQIADVLVLPRPDLAITKYGFPSKLPEYMASGKPVIATDVGDHHLLVKNMATGLLVPPHVKEIAEAILYLIKDDSLGKRLGAAARHFVKNEYTWDVIGERINEVYEETLATKRAV